MNGSSRRIAQWVATAIVCMMWASVSFGQSKSTLNVYSAYTPDDVGLIEAAFERAHPEIDVVMTHDLPGLIAARMLAEAGNRQADVVHGMSATSLLHFDEQGMLEAYAPRGVERLDPRYVDRRTPPHWVGMGIYSTVVCLNTVEAAARELPAPHSWSDLTKPIYAGQILAPDPASSGTGFMAVSAWLQLMGEERGWQFMDALHENIAHYTRSGGKACIDVAMGEYAVGISIDTRTAREKAKGAPIDILLMAEGLGWELDGVAIMKGTAKVDAARRFLDWSVSDEAMKLYERAYSVVSIPGAAQLLSSLPADLPDRLIDNDLVWAAANRERIVAEWTRRYGAR